MMQNLPKSESIFLWYFELFGRVRNYIVSNHLIPSAKFFNSDGRNDADDCGHKFGVDEILFFGEWLDDDIIEIFDVIVPPA